MKPISVIEITLDAPDPVPTVRIPAKYVQLAAGFTGLNWKRIDLIAGSCEVQDVFGVVAFFRFYRGANLSVFADSAARMLTQNPYEYFAVHAHILECFEELAAMVYYAIDHDIDNLLWEGHQCPHHAINHE